MPKGKIDLMPGVVAQIPSRSLPKQMHDIRLSKNGLVYCDCEGYRWRAFCQHIQTMIDQNPASTIIVKAGLREKIAHLTKVIETLDE